ncbi:MAG: hypothetical protein A2W35_04635 [Chloroflexi bacterium RBG_16_57_11]|nr:MAG: hypothetical protein A2W35_04635 [Chloroflexi bacterium RBG_16_57_11]
MKPWILLAFSLILVACTSTVASTQSTQSARVVPFSPTASVERSKPSNTEEITVMSVYPDLGPAPELAGNVWLNSQGSLHLSDLRGKVVLVDMWTFG